MVEPNERWIAETTTVKRNSVVGIIHFCRVFRAQQLSPYAFSQ